MELTEKAAYAKGLLDGLELDPKDKQTKVFKVIIELLGDIAEEISELEQCYDDVSDKIDGIDEELSGIEDILFHKLDEDDEDFQNDSPLTDSESELSQDLLYEVTCPTCDEVIALDEDALNQGSMKCPKCGEVLEFDYDEDELDDILDDLDE